jgi:hypothetical protein
MKSSKLKICALVLTMALVMSGCGDKPYTLTDQEQAIIVNYSSHVVAKYNKRQPDGLCYTAPSKDTKSTEKPASTEKQTEKKPEVDTSKGTAGGTTHQTSANASTEQSTQVAINSLTAALGLSGLTATYTGAEVKTSYKQPNYFALDASAGKTFVILHIKLNNTTTSEISCDMLSKKAGFVTTINGTVTANAKTTILLNDLGTLQEKIAAGKTLDTVLLFEVPADQVKTVDRVDLKVDMNGQSKNMGL